MSLELTDVFRAARLLQWGLQPRIRPIQNSEYRELVREYLNRSEFRDAVHEMSDGLGLYVLNVSEHGVVLSPREESVFWMRASEFRPGNSSADTRLLDGLVEITIAATVFPRARDLEDDVNRPRPPVTVDEIDDALRAICARFKEEFADVDPDMDDVRTGLYDAWRVYDNTLAQRETKDGREARNSSRRIIKYNLERLKEFGCFTETRYAGKEAWQPTRRYNVLVQELAASKLFDEVLKIKNGGAPQEDVFAEDDMHTAPTEQPEEDWGSAFRDQSVELDDMGDAIPREKRDSEDDERPDIDGDLDSDGLPDDDLFEEDADLPDEDGLYDEADEDEAFDGLYDEDDMDDAGTYDGDDEDEDME
ncbi:MAG: hypothetical protein IJ268_05555 [Proteobacteria bacterium]|nr:hypothetical protein [Pseudomonadota bacterium]